MQHESEPNPAYPESNFESFERVLVSRSPRPRHTLASSSFITRLVLVSRSPRPRLSPGSFLSLARLVLSSGWPLLEPKGELAGFEVSRKDRFLFLSFPPVKLFFVLVRPRFSLSTLGSCFSQSRTRKLATKNKGSSPNDEKWNLD